MPTQYPEPNPRSRAYYRRRARQRRAEDAQWAAQSGPVTVRQGPRVESGHERSESAGETTGGAVVRDDDRETLATTARPEAGPR